MTEYTIKITGQGTERDIIKSLSLMVQTMKSKRARRELDAPKFQDLDGCGWNDLTLETFIEIVK